MVQFSRSVVSDSATPWTAARQASLSITNSGACSNSCPLSEWFHPAISSSVVPLSSCLQSFPASGSFPMSQFFASGGQSIVLKWLTKGNRKRKEKGTLSVSYCFSVTWVHFIAVSVGPCTTQQQCHSLRLPNTCEWCQQSAGLTCTVL